MATSLVRWFCRAKALLEHHLPSSCRLLDSFWSPSFSQVLPHSLAAHSKRVDSTVEVGPRRDQAQCVVPRSPGEEGICGEDSLAQNSAGTRL